MSTPEEPGGAVPAGSGRSRLTRRYRTSLATRVTLLAALAVGVAVAVAAMAAYVVVRQQSISTLDESLHDRAESVADNFYLYMSTGQRVPQWALAVGDVKLSFIYDYTKVEAQTPRTPLQVGRPELEVAQGERSTSARTVQIGGVDYRVVAVPLRISGSALVLGQSLQPTEAMLDRLGLVTLLVGMIGVIIAAVAGMGVARNGLLPVRRLTGAVEDIARTERLEPIPVEGNDEIARLSHAFNQMVVSLSGSQTRQRQLVADAGHELRTPLTSLRTNLDLLIQADDSAMLTKQMRRELMDDVRGQIEEMTTLIGDLVELAREDPTTAPVEPVDLAATTQAALTRVRRRSTGQEFDVEMAPWWLVGDAAALERAATNLLDNAVKWSPPGGVIRVRLHQGTLTVADQGHGIAEADLPHVFDRFYRSAESRSMPGSGLGLSIVRAVAERHGGTVGVENAPEGGARFWLRLPGGEGEPRQR